MVPATRTGVLTELKRDELKSNLGVMPAKAGVQYSAALAMNL
jgi:hypothetical protein